MITDMDLDQYLIETPTTVARDYGDLCQDASRTGRAQARTPERDFNVDRANHLRPIKPLPQRAQAAQPVHLDYHPRSYLEYYAPPYWSARSDHYRPLRGSSLSTPEDRALTRAMADLDVRNNDRDDRRDRGDRGRNRGYNGGGKRRRDGKLTFLRHLAPNMLTRPSQMKMISSMEAVVVHSAAVAMTDLPVDVSKKLLWLSFVACY